MRNRTGLYLVLFVLCVVLFGFIARANEDGIECMTFGDLFLPDIREYRENQLRETGITPIFPIWKIPTDILAQQMLSSGVEVYISTYSTTDAPRPLGSAKTG